MQEKDVGISKGDINMEEKIVKVLNVMSEYLSIAQMKKLQEVIIQTIAENEAEKAEIANDKFDIMTFAPLYAIINIYLHTHFYQGRR